MGNVLSSNSTSEASGTNRSLEVWANWLPALVVVVVFVSVSILSLQFTHHVKKFCGKANGENVQRCKPSAKSDFDKAALDVLAKTAVDKAVAEGKKPP